MPVNLVPRALRTRRNMEVVDLMSEGFDSEICEQLRGLLKNDFSSGKEAFLSVLSQQLGSSCTVVLALASKQDLTTEIYGGVFVEYYVELNCGLVRGLVLKDRSNCDGCRLLMERVSSTLNKYSQAHGNDKVEEIFCCTTRISKPEKHHMCLYDVGFHLVDTRCLKPSLRCRENVLLLVYRPDLVPNFQVEDGVSSDCVKRDSVVNICEELYKINSGEVMNLSQPPVNPMFVKAASTPPDIVPVSPSFPWHGELGPSLEDQVLVVGAGVAGLAAAASLSEAGFSVILLEAANYIGGRVKQVQPFPGFPPVDLGAEFIHGSNTITMKLAEENKWVVKSGHKKDAIGADTSGKHFYLNNELHSLCDHNPAVQAWDDVLATGWNTFDKIYDQELNFQCETCHSDCLVNRLQEEHIPENVVDVAEAYQVENVEDSTSHCCGHESGMHSQTVESCESGKPRSSLATEDMSLLELLKRKGCSDDTVAVFEAVYAQTEGGCLDELGVYECARDDFIWDYGCDNLRLEGSYSLLIEHYLNKCKAVDKRLNWQVKEVLWKDKASSCEEYSDFHRQNKQQIILKNQFGQVLAGKHVILTVPLTILKEGDITFTPCLPISKQTAISAIQMRGALKLVCRFRTPFWAEYQECYLARGFLSQIWMFSRDPNEDGEQCHMIGGFQTAEHAERKVGVSEEEMLEKFIHQLDEVFGSSDNPTPASDNYMDYVYYHWSKNPFIRGGYSSPTAHAYGLRHELAKPVETRLFFAGEATSIKCASTVHTAIETGIRAAGEVCRVAGKCSVARKL